MYYVIMLSYKNIVIPAISTYWNLLFCASDLSIYNASFRAFANIQVLGHYWPLKDTMGELKDNVYVLYTMNSRIKTILKMLIYSFLFTRKLQIKKEIKENNFGRNEMKPYICSMKTDSELSFIQKKKTNISTNFVLLIHNRIQ